MPTLPTGHICCCQHSLVCWFDTANPFPRNLYNLIRVHMWANMNLRAHHQSTTLSPPHPHRIQFISSEGLRQNTKLPELYQGRDMLWVGYRCSGEAQSVFTVFWPEQDSNGIWVIYMTSVLGGLFWILAGVDKKYLLITIKTELHTIKFLETLCEPSIISQTSAKVNAVGCAWWGTFYFYTNEAPVLTWWGSELCCAVTWPGTWGYSWMDTFCRQFIHSLL